MFRTWLIAILCFALAFLAVVRPPVAEARGSDGALAQEGRGADSEEDGEPGPAKELKEHTAAPAPLRSGPRSSRPQETAMWPFDPSRARPQIVPAPHPVPAEFARRNGAGANLRR